MMKWYIDCIEDVSKQLQMLAEDKTRAKRPQRPGQKTEHTKTQETWLQHISYTERRKETRAHGGRERQGQHAHKGGRERERLWSRKNLQKDKDPDPKHLEGGTKRENERKREVPGRRREDKEETPGRKRERGRQKAWMLMCLCYDNQTEIQQRVDIILINRTNMDCKYEADRHRLSSWWDKTLQES